MICRILFLFIEVDLAYLTYGVFFCGRRAGRIILIFLSSICMRVLTILFLPLEGIPILPKLHSVAKDFHKLEQSISKLI